MRYIIKGERNVFYGGFVVRKVYKYFLVDNSNHKECLLKIGAIAVVFIISFPVSAASLNSSDLTDSKKNAAPIFAEKVIEKKWGIQPISMQLTATNYMLDFRYRVVDPVKAAKIINRKIKPYLVVEKTGNKLNIASSYKVGPLRQTAQFAKVDRNYFMLFANPGRLVKKGDKVTIVADDFKLKNVTVR